ncbi:MAG: iron complex transport system permease protein [Eubacteriaceae bacterium]|nr:iron complex transport system permease protein [Eubacteriaceae bacterium]
MPRKISLILFILPLVLLATILLSLIFGRYAMCLTDITTTFKEVFLSLINHTPLNNSNNEIVLFKVRLPRIFMALLCGGALALAGHIYQQVFKNPLVSPDILGASSGAGFGAAVGILLKFNLIGTQITAFFFGLLATGLVLFIGQVLYKGRATVYVFILLGLTVNAVMNAGISLSKYIADPYDDLTAITFMLMGSLSKADWYQVLTLLLILIACALFLRKDVFRIQLLSLSDDEAETLGVNVSHLRTRLIVIATLLTSATVATCGIIGWVGLIVPHMVRKLMRGHWQHQFIITWFGGALFLLLIDDLARNIMSTEVPLSILTAVLGAPIFLGILFGDVRLSKMEENK